MTLKNINKLIYSYITLGLFFVKVISSHFIFVKKDPVIYLRIYIIISSWWRLRVTLCTVRAPTLRKKWHVCSQMGQQIKVVLVCTDCLHKVYYMLHLRSMHAHFSSSRNQRRWTLAALSQQYKSKGLGSSKALFCVKLFNVCLDFPFLSPLQPITCQTNVSCQNDINRPFFIYWPWNWIWKTNQCIKYISYRMWVDLWNLFSSDSVLCNSEWYHL